MGHRVALEKKKAGDNPIGIKVKDNLLYVNNQIQQEVIQPLQLTDILQMDIEDRDDLEQVSLTKGESLTEKGNELVSYAVKTHSLSEARKAYRRVRQLHPDADHIVCAYKIVGYEGCCDDREHMMGLKLWRLLTTKGKQDCVVFVSKKYSGARLGPRRFLLYQNLAAAALNKV